MDIVRGTLPAKLQTRDLSSGSSPCVLRGSSLLTPCDSSSRSVEGLPKELERNDNSIFGPINAYRAFWSLTPTLMVNAVAGLWFLPPMPGSGLNQVTTDSGKLITRCFLWHSPWGLDSVGGTLSASSFGFFVR